MKPLPAQTVLRELLDYDPKTGLLTWKFRENMKGSWNVKYAGKTAFTYTNPKGYLTGTIDGIRYLAHRIIWVWLYGTEPDSIDHIDGNRANNAQANLRSVTVLMNQQNQKRRADNSSGCVGVRYRKDIEKYQAYINVNRKQLTLGAFDSFDEAVAARKHGEIQYGFHENHGR